MAPIVATKKLLYGNHGGGLVKVPLTLIGALTTEYHHVVVMGKISSVFFEFSTDWGPSKWVHRVSG